LAGSAGLKTLIAVIGRSDLEEVRKDVERALGVTLEAHDSLYMGGAYYGAGRKGGETITLSRNYVYAMDDCLEAEYKDWPLLLRVYMTPRGSELAQALGQVPQLSVVRVSPSATGP